MQCPEEDAMRFQLEQQQQLLQELQRLRDATTKLSISLYDLQFVFDTQSAKKASETAFQLIARSRMQQH